MNSLHITHEELSPQMQYVKFSGILDMSGEKEVLALEQIINTFLPKTRVIFDFQDLNYLNSYAIGFIAHWYNSLHKNESEIVLVKPQPQVYDVLHVLGITNVLKIFESLEEAKV